MNKPALDAIDIKILAAIQNHGQISKVKLAELINLSPTPCWTRLAKLKRLGYVDGYRANINLAKITDFTRVIVTVSLKNHKKSDFQRFENHIGNISAITECYATGGGSDYVLTVFTGNLHAFQALMEGLLEAEIGIERYIIYIVTRQVKSVEPPLSALVKPTLEKD